VGEVHEAVFSACHAMLIENGRFRGVRLGSCVPCKLSPEPGFEVEALEPE